MISVRLIKRISIVLAYLLLLGILMFGIGKAWVYFNSGANRAEMLKPSLQNGRFYNPVTNFNIENAEGRIPTIAEISKLETDYINGVYLISAALNLNDSLGLENYTTREYRKRITGNIQLQSSQNISTETLSLNHDLELFYFSEDGKFAVLKDTNVHEIVRTFSEQKPISESSGISSYKVILLLEDGRWRIRMKERTNFKMIKAIVSKIQPIDEQLRGINYYPQNHPWDLFGDNFSEETLRRDFQLLRNSNLNSIRIFIPYQDFGKEYVNEKMTDQLIKLMDIAQSNDLKVILTLFDFYGDYSTSDIVNTNSHLDKIVSSVKSHPALLAYDLKNEPDLDFNSRGKENVMRWLKIMIKMLRAKDPQHPITIGWSSIEMATHLKDEIDFISFHYYDDPKNLESSFNSLNEQIVNKPIVMSEFGMSSYSGFWNLWSASEEKQKDYHIEMQDLISKYDLPFLSWTLYDFSEIPEKVVGKKPWRKNPQKYFGFIDEKGRKKPAFNYINSN